jgi:hypothetical protein
MRCGSRSGSEYSGFKPDVQIRWISKKSQPVTVSYFSLSISYQFKSAEIKRKHCPNSLCYPLIVLNKVGLVCRSKESDLET